MPRLFLGLALPGPVKDELISWKDDIPEARWQSRDQLHLTLCFLGQVAPERVPAVFRALEGLQGPAFKVHPMGVGCFGEPQAPRNLWADVQPHAPMQTLHADLCHRLEQGGFPSEARRFRPHITLARFGRRQGATAEGFLDQYRAREAPEFVVNGIDLFFSQPGDQGSRYTILAHFPLEGAEPLAASGASRNS